MENSSIHKSTAVKNILEKESKNNSFICLFSLFVPIEIVYQLFNKN